MVTGALMTKPGPGAVGRKRFAARLRGVMFHRRMKIDDLVKAVNSRGNTKIDGRRVRWLRSIGIHDTAKLKREDDIQEICHVLGVTLDQLVGIDQIKGMPEVDREERLSGIPATTYEDDTPVQDRIQQANPTPPDVVEDALDKAVKLLQGESAERFALIINFYYENQMKKK